MTNQVRSKCINEAFKAVLDHPKDVTIVSAENQIFYVNRLLLSLFSSTLSSLLSSPTCSPSSIILPDCSISSIKQLFDILQKGFTSINKVDGSKVIETAGILGISIDKLNTNNEKENNVDKNTPFRQMRKRYRSGPEKRDVETADILGISNDKLNTNNEKEINSNKNSAFSQMRKRYRSGPEKRDVEVLESQPLLKKRHKSGSSNQNKKLRSEELMNLSEESVVHKNSLKHQPQHTPKKQEKRQIQSKPKQQIIPTPKKQIPPQSKPQISPKKKQQIPPQPKQQIQPHQIQDTLPKQKHLEMHLAPLQLKPQISLQEQQPSEDLLSEITEVILPHKEVSKIDMSKDNSAQAQTVKIQWDIFDEVCLTVKDAPIEVDTPQSNAIDKLEETPGASGYGVDKENAATIGSKGNQINEKSILVENQQPIENINIPKTCSTNQIQAIIANTNETLIPSEIQKTVIKKDVLKEVFSSVKDEAIKINDVPCNETPQNKDIPKKTVDTKDADYKTPDQLYLCQICSKDIPKARLRVHYSGHFVKEMKQYENLTKENECLICNKKFSNKQSCLRHVGMAHEKLDEFLVEKGMVPIKNKNESRKIKSTTKDKVITLNKHENSTSRDDLSLIVTKEVNELGVQVIPENEATGISQNLNEIVDKLTVINQNNQLNTEFVDLQKPTNKDPSKRLTSEKNVPMEIQEYAPIKIEPVEMNDTLNIEKNIPEDPKSITKHTLQTTINQDIIDKVCLSIKDEPADYNQDEVPNIETNALVEIPLTTINRDVLDKVCLAIKDEPTLMEENSEMESSPFEMETIIEKETLDTICSGIKEEPLNLKRSCQISVKDCLNLVKENQCIHCKKIFFHKKILRRHIGMAHKKDDNKKDDNETISERGVLPINKRFENTRVDKGKKRSSVNKKKNILQGSKLPPKHRHRRYEK